MKRCMLVGLTFVGGFLQLAAGAAAQDLSVPSVTRHYRFLPRVSRLIEMDPVFDPPIPWIVLGEFDFSNWTNDPRAFVPAPNFANVDAWASHPMLAISVDLDGVVNLTGMQGRQLNPSWPEPPRVEVFQFKGEDGNGYPADVFVARAGRWLYMRGENHPNSAPTEHGPFRSKWALKAIARQTPFPDFDRSDTVDSGDLNKWVQGFGDSNRPEQVAQSLGDADGDRDIDGADFLSWQRDLGDAPPDFAMFDAAIEVAITSAASAVPEPSAGALIAFGIAALAARRRVARSAAQ